MSSYYCEFILMPNLKHGFKYENLAHQIFFWIEDLDTWANLCGNNLYPESIKNDNGAVVMRKNVCNANRTNNSINLIKDDIGEYNTFLNVPLCSCIFSIKLKVLEVLSYAYYMRVSQSCHDSRYFGYFIIWMLPFVTAGKKI